MRYFPHKIGINILFKKDIDGNTLFGLRVQYLFLVQKDINGEQQRQKELVNLIDTTLAQYSIASPIPLRVGDALIVAATDASIHLECVYSLTRTYPDTILGMLRHQYQHQETTTEVASSTNTIGTGSTNDGTDNDNTSNNNNSNININSIVRRSTRKRKRN